MPRRAPKVDNIEWDEAGWDQLLIGVVNDWALPRAEAIADVCNDQVAKVSKASLAEDNPTPGRKAGQAISHQEPPDGKRDYMVSVEGSNPLDLRDYRATVITVTNRAKIDNARNNSLVRNLYRAGGAE